MRRTTSLRQHRIQNGLVEEDGGDYVRVAGGHVALKHYIAGCGTLIVTSKACVEDWASVVRNMPSARLHVYTEPLASRRRKGAHNLAQYDVVVTTFDVRISN
jgi:hypothetical protein